MAEFKLVISDPKSGKTVQKEAKEALAEPFLGKKIGEKIDGALVGFDGYEFEICGGSDYCGFPMRKGIIGLRRSKLLIGKGLGCSGKERKLRKHTKPRRRKGFRKNKTVCPQAIYDKITQINLKVLKPGTEQIFTAKPEEAKAAQ